MRQTSILLCSTLFILISLACFQGQVVSTTPLILPIESSVDFEMEMTSNNGSLNQVYDFESFSNEPLTLNNHPERRSNGLGIFSSQVSTTLDLVVFTISIPITSRQYIGDFTPNAQTPWIHSCRLQSTSLQIDTDNALTSNTPNKINGIFMDSTSLPLFQWSFTLELAADDYQITCFYNAPYTVAMSVSITQPDEVRETKYTYLHSVGNLSARLFPTASYYNVNGGVLSLTINGLYGFSNPVLSKLLRFKLTGITTTNPLCVQFLSNSQSSLTATWSASESILSFPDGLMEDAFAILCGIYPSRPSSAHTTFGFQVGMNGISGSLVDMEPSLISINLTPPDPSQYANLEAVAPVNRWNIVNDEVVDTNWSNGSQILKFRYSVILNTGEHTIVIRPPGMLRNNLFFIKAEYPTITGASHKIFDDASGIEIQILGDEGRAALSTHKVFVFAIPSSFSSFVKTLGSFDFDIFSPLFEVKSFRSQGETVYSLPAPWVSEKFVTPSPFTIVRSITTDVNVAVSPLQYGQFVGLDGLARWKVQFSLPGGWQGQNTSVKIERSSQLAALTSSNLRHINTAYYKFTTDTTTHSLIGDPLLFESSPIFLLDTNVDNEFIFTPFDSPTLLLDIKSTFMIELRPISIPYQQGDDFAYSPPGSQATDIWISNRVQHGAFADQLLIPLKPPYLPQISVTSSSHNNFELVRSQTLWVPLTFSFSSKPQLYPDIDVDTLDSSSTWRFHKNAVVYPGSVLTIVCEMVGGEFHSTNPLVSELTLWATPVTTIHSNKITLLFDYKSEFQSNWSDDFTLQFAVKGLEAQPFINIQTNVYVTMDPSLAPVSLLPNTVQFNLGQIIDSEQYGIDSSPQFTPPEGGSQFELVNADGSLINTPNISYATTAHFAFTPTINTFQAVTIQLFHKNDNGDDELIKNIKTLSTTNGLLTHNERMRFNSVYQNCFFRYSFPFDPSGGLTTEVYIIDSIPFDIVPGCKARDVNNPTQIISLCTGVNEQCVRTGKCEVVSTVDPSTLPPSPSSSLPPTTERCPQCDLTTTSTCTATNDITNTVSTCQCNDGWSGRTCQQSNSCDPKKSKCNPDNGYSLPIPGSTNCESQCHCYNQWAGLSCQTCQLQCFNDGLRYNDCARCGCQEGYSGSQCQCQSVNAKLTLKATNDIIISSYGKLSNSDQGLFSVDHERLSKFTFPFTPTEEQIVFISILRDLYNGLKTPLTSSPDGKYDMTVNPTNDQSATQFNFRIVFDCPGNNDYITSLEMLKEKWNNFVNVFVQQPVIGKYFTFNYNEDEDVITGEVQATPSTLPMDYERLSNHSIVAGIGYCLFMSAFLSILF